MEKRYSTQTITIEEERQITKDLSILKKSIPFAEEIDKLTPEFDDARKRRREIGEQLGEHKREIEGREKEIEGYRKEMEVANSQRQGVYEKKDELEAEIGGIKDTLDELYTKKDAERENYFQSKLNYENEYDLIKYSEWIVKQKTYIKENEEYRTKRI